MNDLRAKFVVRRPEQAQRSSGGANDFVAGTALRLFRPTWLSSIHIPAHHIPAPNPITRRGWQENGWQEYGERNLS
jgi:hypothetical protein